MEKLEQARGMSQRLAVNEANREVYRLFMAIMEPVNEARSNLGDIKALVILINFKLKEDFAQIY